MLARDLGMAVLYDDHRSANSTAVTSDVDSVMVMIDVDTDKLAESPGST